MLSQNQKKVARRARLKTANGEVDSLIEEDVYFEPKAPTLAKPVDPVEMSLTSSVTMAGGASSGAVSTPKVLSQSQKRRARLKLAAASSLSTLNSTDASVAEPLASAKKLSLTSKASAIKENTEKISFPASSPPAPVLPPRPLVLPWAGIRVRPQPIPEEEVQRLINLLATPHQYYIFVLSTDSWKLASVGCKFDDFYSPKTSIGQCRESSTVCSGKVYLNVISSNRDMAYASIYRHVKNKMGTLGSLKIELAVGGCRRYDELLVAAAEKVKEKGLFDVDNWFEDFRIGNKKIDIKAACRAKTTTGLSSLLALSQGDVDVCEYHGLTAVHVAAMYGNYELASAIVEKAMKTSKKTKWVTMNGRTPLHYAVSSNNIEFVSLFIKFLTPFNLLNAKDHYGRSAGDIAHCIENFEIERLLMNSEVPSLRELALEKLVRTLSSSGPLLPDISALPTGFNVYSEIPLHNYSALSRLAEHFSIPSAYLSQSMASLEVRYGHFFSQGLSSHLNDVMYLIPVWSHLHTFHSPSPLPSLGKVLVPASRHAPSPVASKELFMKRLDTRSRHVLSSISWANVMLIGGMALSCFVANNDVHADAFKSSDIDLYIVGLSGEAFCKKVASLVTEIYALFPKHSTVVRTSHTITITSENRSFPTCQVILAPYSCPAHLLFTTDLDCTALGFDGAQLWATPRAREAIVRRENAIRVEKYNVRGEWQTEARLTKYAQRGFQVVDLGLHASSHIRPRASDVSVLQTACALPLSRYDEAVEMVLSTGLHGAGLLLMLESVPRLRELLLYQRPEALAPGTTLSSILKMVSDSLEAEAEINNNSNGCYGVYKECSSSGGGDSSSSDKPVYDVGLWGKKVFATDCDSDMRICASGGSRDPAERKSILEFSSGYGASRTRMLVVNPVYWDYEGTGVSEKKLPLKQRRRTDEALTGKDCPLNRAITELDIEADKFPVRNWYDGIPSSALVTSQVVVAQ